MRLSIPDGYRIPPHFHPVNEHVTVIWASSSLAWGTALMRPSSVPCGWHVLDDSGRYAPVCSGQARYRAAVHGTGPWKLTYVNPADQPKPTTSQ